MKFKLFLSFLYLTALPVLSQTSFMPTELIAEPGEQKSNNLTSGTSNTLRVSTSSSFGTNVSASTSGRFSTISKSNLKLAPFMKETEDGKLVIDHDKSSYTSTFGSTANNDGTTNNGIINVDVTNKTEDGIGSREQTIDGDSFSINDGEISHATGSATVQGIFNSLSINFDGPNSTSETEIKDLKALNLDPETDTTESNVSENPIDTANSSSGVRMDQSLNVDVSNNNFTNAFSQAF